MKNDSTTASVNDGADQKKPAAAPANGQKAGEAQAKRHGGERASLPGERAEGEGMIAPDPDAEVEGEGSYTATRAYDEGVERSIASGKTEELAKKAAAALDGPEGDSLRKAEQAAKQGHSN
jgi:hypothetical protein